jgi:GABA(A) receptor-associated protein
MLFKQEHPFEDRKIESNRIMSKYPDRIPIICEKQENCKNIKSISKKKYLVPTEYTCGQFIYIIRNQLHLSAESAIFLFVDGIIPSTAQTVGQLYNNHKDYDGFLYINYASENTFG